MSKTLEDVARAIQIHMGEFGPDHEGLARAALSALLPVSEEVVEAMTNRIFHRNAVEPLHQSVSAAFTAAVNHVLNQP